MQKKFIEHDLPLEEISEESAREKNINHGHPSSLHLWWARKPLAASRAVALATLLDDPGEKNPEEREEIRDLIKNIVPWEEVKSGNSENIKRAQELVEEQYGDSPPKVFDPFAGGGSIPLEFLRMGADTYASDYNPVAVLIEKATVEWPQKFGIEVEIPERLQEKVNSEELSLGSAENKVNLLFFMVERWANKVLKKTKEEIGQFYPEESGAGLVGKREITKKSGWNPICYYYNRTIPCQNPNCKASIPLTVNYWLAKKSNKKVAYRPIIDKNTDGIDFELLQGEELEAAINDGFDPNDGTVSRANVTCPVCGQVTEAEQVRQLATDGYMDQRMTALVFHHPNETGKKYRLSEKRDTNIFEKATEYLNQKLDNWNYVEEPLPNEKIAEISGKFNVTSYGLKKWKDLFNSRQQLALITILENIRSSYSEIGGEINVILETQDNLNVDQDELQKAIMGYLGIILDRQSRKNASLVEWNSYGEKLENAFNVQALQMMWDYVETNIFSGVNGDWSSNRDWVLRYIDNNKKPGRTQASTKQSSATDLPFADNTFNAIITDPPYYYDITYADLSDFFYVWLKRSIGEYFPELFSTPLVPKSEEILEGYFWDKELYQHKDSDFFEKKLKEAFSEMNRVLSPGGIAAIIYAHKTTEGWETMLNSLINTGFVVTASWPVHTEMKNRLTAAHSASLASSIYMICRKTEREKLGFWKDLKPKIQEKVEGKLDQFWKEGVVGGDLFISAIGPGMEIFSQYEEVQKYSGEKVSTRELLTFIRFITTDFVVNRLLKEASPSEIDKESQFYLAYRWTYLDNKIEYDAARKIASGMGVDIEEMDDETGFVKKTRKYVRVYGPEDRTDYDGKVEDIEVNTMVDAMHKSLLLWEDGRKDEINELLAETGYAEQGSFWQFCQAVSESLVQGNNEKKKLEGFLMGRDKYVQSAKEMNKQGEDTKELFE